MRSNRRPRTGLFLGTALVLLVSCVGAASSSASTIRDRPEYRPSSSIYFTDSGALTGGTLLGDTPTSGQFQINLEYYNTVPTDRAAVNQYNDNCLNGPPPGGCESPSGLNWVDPEYYTLTLTLDGSADVWSDDVLVAQADWAITGEWSGYEHTVFFGTVIDKDSSTSITDGDYLEIEPEGYHSFFGNGWANANEQWNLAVLPTEVLGYEVSQTGPSQGLLSVHLVPEPTTALLLLAGLAGLSYRRR